MARWREMCEEDLSPTKARQREGPVFLTLLSPFR